MFHVKNLYSSGFSKRDENDGGNGFYFLLVS